MNRLPEIQERTLYAAFQRALQKCPDDIAHVGPDGACYSFADSYRRSLRLAGGFRALGLAHQQPAALLLDNSVDAVQLWLALGLGGFVEVPVNSAYKGKFLSHILDDSGATILVIEEDYIPRLLDVVDQLTALRTVVVRGDVSAAAALTRHLRVVSFVELENAEPMEPAAPDAAALMAIMYTSGTTGPSKGVLESHAHAYTYASREDQAAPREGDRVLVTLPLFHLAGQWYGVYQALIHRLRCVIEPSFSVSRFWPLVRAHGISYTLLLGAMAELLQQQAPRPDDADNPLKLVVMAPLASGVDTFCKRFNVAAAAVYGMSEIGAVLNGPPETLEPGEAGLVRDGFELRLVDGEGQDVREGQVGELWVRPVEPLTVMRGYHNLPEKTAATLCDGWVHSGDTFRRDARGHYFFCDRLKDALRRRGENISSFELEAVINEYADVYESAVVAVPAELGEDEIKAAIVPREGRRIDPQALIHFLIERLPYFMVPRYLEFLPELPKTPTQKVRKNVVRDAGVGYDTWDREAAGIVLGRKDR